MVLVLVGISSAHPVWIGLILLLALFGYKLGW